MGYNVAVQHELTVFADYFQFYVVDDDAKYVDFADLWTPELVERTRVAFVDHAVAVATARNMEVNVVVRFHDRAPEVDIAEHMVEGDLVCESGHLVVMGCTEVFSDAPRLTVDPGRYRVRVTYIPYRRPPDEFGRFLLYQVDVWPTIDPQIPDLLVAGPTAWAGPPSDDAETTGATP